MGSTICTRAWQPLTHKVYMRECMRNPATVCDIILSRLGRLIRGLLVAAVLLARFAAFSTAIASTWSDL